jgi:glyoxylase-like metal-dependent hydrolase (beta-lactamase superfamily II)
MRFTFNDFQENTYVLYDESHSCVIIDPGNNNDAEDNELFDAIEARNLKPVAIINTHCHLDHILGNGVCKKRFKIPVWMHRKDLPILNLAEQSSHMWGVPFRGKPEPDGFIEEGEKFSFGNTSLEIFFVPGHSPGHIALYHAPSSNIIVGDVLFHGSTGRVDLPFCNGADLCQSIQEKLYTLPDETIVWPGHGEETTTGEEKQNNPIVRSGYCGL